MTDFVARALRPEMPDYPVRSLQDVDFYKFTMLYFIWVRFKHVVVRYECINRAVNIPLADIVDERQLRKALDHVRTLRFTNSDLALLFGQEYYGRNMFPWEFIQALRDLRLPPYRLERKDNQYVLAFEGSWFEVELWETIALAVIFQLYAQSLLTRMSRFELEVFYARATERVFTNLRRLQEYPGIRFADFGQRRRHSYLWQEHVLGLCKEFMGNQFIGISNTFLAFKHNKMPIGTNAHSLRMAYMATVFDAFYKKGDLEAIRRAQYDTDHMWAELYGPGLRILLPDAYGTAQYLAGAPETFARDWRGVRQDSGDPFEIGELIVDWYKQWGIRDPKAADKLIIFSDGLNVDLMIELYRAFSERINISFGWGTLLTNGFDGCHPNPDKPVPGLDGLLWGEIKWAFSLVCKIVAGCGNPAVKLPDNLAKSTGPVEEQRRYAEVFGREHRTAQACIV